MGMPAVQQKVEMFSLLFDLEDYATTYRATRDAYLKAANELKLATGPYKESRALNLIGGSWILDLTNEKGEYVYLDGGLSGEAPVARQLEGETQEARQLEESQVQESRALNLIGG